MGYSAPRLHSSQGFSLDVSAARELLEGIESLESGSTGALSYGSASQPRGTVFVEDGRVCWAMAGTSGRRLTDLLARQSDPPVEPSKLEAVYQHCRRVGTPLGEALVSSGLVSPDGLRAALLQHTTECIAVMSPSSSRAPVWAPHRHERYNARYTFTPAEILVRLGALVHRQSTVKALDELGSTLDAGGGGVAFARGASPLPIASIRASELTISELMDLGRWGVDALDMADAISPRRDFVLATTGYRHGVGAWIHEGLVFVALFEDPSTSACALVRRVRARSR